MLEFVRRSGRRSYNILAILSPEWDNKAVNIKGKLNMHDPSNESLGPVEPMPDSPDSAPVPDQETLIKSMDAAKRLVRALLPNTETLALAAEAFGEESDFYQGLYGVMSGQGRDTRDDFYYYVDLLTAASDYLAVIEPVGRENLPPLET